MSQIKKVISPHSQGTWIPKLGKDVLQNEGAAHIFPQPQGLLLTNIARYWLFCGYCDRALRGGKLANPSISLFLSFFVKKVYIKCLRSRGNAMESLCSPKIKAKIRSRTKNVEVSKIVTNSEIHLHDCLCESSDFKIGRSSHQT